jgi:hypothetical protein
VALVGLPTIAEAEPDKRIKRRQDIDTHLPIKAETRRKIARVCSRLLRTFDPITLTGAAYEKW